MTVTAAARAAAGRASQWSVAAGSRPPPARDDRHRRRVRRSRSRPAQWSGAAGSRPPPAGDDRHRRRVRRSRSRLAVVGRRRITPAARER